MAGTPPTILTPKSREGRRFPWWTLGTFALLAGVLSLAGPHLPPPTRATPTALAGSGWALGLLCSTLLGCAGAAALGGWWEARCWLWLSRRAPFWRFLGSLLLPAVVFFAAARTRWAAPDFGRVCVAFVGVVGIYWFLGSAVGSALMVTIDVVVSALVQRFRSRVLFAVSALLLIASMGAAVLAAMALRMVRRAQEGHLSPSLSLHRSSKLEWEAVHHPLLIAALVFVVAAVLVSPVVLSALSKLAEGVTERIHPLSLALDQVGSGRRDLRVEEAGSIEFVQLARRFNRMVETLALAERMEHAFGMYVGTHVMRRIREQHGEALLPASVREATVLFADIRGFTTMSEQLTPEAMVSLLNRYFDRVVAVVDAHDGYLNKFIGDAVMVIFNGPLDQADHPERAARCAIALQEAVSTLDREGAFTEVPGGLRVGVGIATGSMVCGNVGGGGQVEYTVIGDVVNLASRLTGAAGGGEVWVNAATAQALPKELPATPLLSIRVKGKAEPVTPYRIWPAELRAVAPAGTIPT